MQTLVQSGTQLKSAMPLQSTQQFLSATPWQALLWKDYRQVRPALAAILIGMLGCQLLLLMSAFLIDSAGLREANAGMIMVIALVSPILVVLACCGMLIGHERQSGTWHWSSGLPIGWQKSLTSKLLVCLGSSLLALGLLLIVPLFSWQLFGGQGVEKWVFDTYGSTISLMLFLNVLTYFLLSTLLFRETLNALLIAMLWMLGTNLVILNMPLGIFENGYQLNQKLNQQAILWSAGSMGVLWLVGLVALVVAYRWRWSTGQFSTLRRGRSAVRTIPRPLHIWDQLQPSEFRMLWHQSWRNSIAKRAGLVGLAVLMVALLVSNPSLLLVASVIPLTLCGLTTFEGDQVNHRFRFLADRGVSPRQLIRARLLAGGSTALVIATIVALGSMWSMELPSGLPVMLVPLAVLSFLVGMLCALCFRKPIVAGTVAVVACLATVIIYASALSYRIYVYESNPHWLFVYALLVLGLVGPIVLYLAVRRFTKIWLIQDQLRLESRCFGLLMFVALGPLFLSAALGFLAVPNPRWQGLPLAAQAEANIQGPDLNRTRQILPAWEPAITVHEIQYIFNFDSEHFYERASKALDAITDDDGFAPSSSDLSTALETLDSRVTIEQPTRYYDDLSTMIVESTALGIIACRRQETELAVSMLKLSRNLQQIALELNPPQTVNARNLACEMLLTLTIDQLHDLSELSELESVLVLDVPDESYPWTQQAKGQATWDRAALRGDPLPQSRFGKHFWRYDWLTRNIPPLRWRQERQIARTLDASLKFIAGGQPLPARTSPHFVADYLAHQSLLARLSTLKVKVGAATSTPERSADVIVPEQELLTPAPSTEPADARDLPPNRQAGKADEDQSPSDDER